MSTITDCWENGELQVQVIRPRSISISNTTQQYLDLCWSLWQQGFALTSSSESNDMKNSLERWLLSKTALLQLEQTFSQREKQLKEALAARNSAPISTTPSSSPSSS